MVITSRDQFASTHWDPFTLGHPALLGTLLLIVAKGEGVETLSEKESVERLRFGENDA